MKNKKNLVIAVMIAVALLMATGYAYFATQLNINATGNITSTWNVYFESINNVEISTGCSNVVTPSVSGTSANMNVNLNLPGDRAVYSIVLKNGGTVPAIIEDIKAEATGSSAIRYAIEGLKIGDKLAAGATKTITIAIIYDPKVMNQPSETSKTLIVTIDAAQDIGQTITSQTPSINQPLLLYNRILDDNTAYADDEASTYVSASTGIDFTKSASDTNGKGLYATNKNTEDNKTVYYFRGDVDNNFVKFGERTIDNCNYNGKQVYYNENVPVHDEDTCSVSNVCYVEGGYRGDENHIYFVVPTGESECTGRYSGVLLEEKANFVEDITEANLWRIVRINEDGSIRLFSTLSAGTSQYSYSMDDNAYVGYMTGTPGSLNYKDTHMNINDSAIKDFLDEWYVNNMSIYSNYLADAGFCNDRSIAPIANSWASKDTALGYGNSITYYGSYRRLHDMNSPEFGSVRFGCPQSNDLFTTNSSFKGNRALTYPIGLLTLDEVVYSGAVYVGTNNTNSYLSNHYEGQAWLTMTPLFFNNSGTTAIAMSLVYNTMYINTGTAINNYYAPTVFPVINLKSNVGVTLEGTGEPGTINNPYVIKTN